MVKEIELTIDESLKANDHSNDHTHQKQMLEIIAELIVYDLMKEKNGRG